MSECQICGPMFIGKCPHRPTDTPDKKPTLGQELTKAAGEAIEWHREQNEKPRDLVTVPASELRKLQDERDELRREIRNIKEFLGERDQLRAERDRLRAALERIANETFTDDPMSIAKNIARAALEGKE